MCIFREVTEQDYEGICKLIRSEEELFLVYPKGQYPFTVAQLHKIAQLRRELTVAVDGYKIVGFANLYNFKPQQSAFIGNVIIGESHRGSGLGRKIVTRMLSIAFEKHQLPVVNISVFSNNTPALLLYSDFGFKPYEIEEREDHQGQRAALIHMKLEHKAL